MKLILSNFISKLQMLWLWNKVATFEKNMRCLKQSRDVYKKVAKFYPFGYTLSKGCFYYGKYKTMINKKRAILLSKKELFVG